MPHLSPVPPSMLVALKVEALNVLFILEHYLIVGESYQLVLRLLFMAFLHLLVSPLLRNQIVCRLSDFGPLRLRVSLLCVVFQGLDVPLSLCQQIEQLFNLVLKEI